MKIIIILIYIIIFILLINLSINIEKYKKIEKYKNIEINKLDGINMYGNLTIKTKKNNFDNVKKICIKDKCIDIDILNKLPYQKGITGQCTINDCTKVCTCPYGKAAKGENCTVHEKEVCISCEKNYKYNSVNKTCVSCEAGKFIHEENHIKTVCCSNTENNNSDNTCSNKKCQCENGEADNENCVDESVTKCKNCNNNYYLYNGECLKCEIGEFTQSENIDKKCCPLGEHYDLSLDSCLLNECTCDGGYPTSGEDCRVHGSEDCKSCKGGKSGEYYYYSPSRISGIEGNKCINCNPEGTKSKNIKKMYSDNHRTTKCCKHREKYDDDSGVCEYMGINPNNYCREGETFIWDDGGYCECPITEIYDLNEKICKDL